MKITALETLRCATQPNLLFVTLHTDEGVAGLGEAFFGARAVEAYLHETVADVLLGVADPTPEGMAQRLTSYLGYQGAGVETRGNGAVDLALWDILGKASGQPLVKLLGGPVRDRLRIYNTCAGPGYVRTSPRQSSENWGLPSRDNSELEDLDGFLHRPGQLARELRAEGIPGMKVWPFDRAAETSGGTHLSNTELNEGIGVVEDIRSAVGSDLDLMIELHGLWDRRTAGRILEALEPFNPFWVEDPLRPDAVDALASLSHSTDIPIAVGETAVGRRGFHALLSRAAIDIANVDVQWTGGLTEARKVAALADTFGVPIAPHDCTGPVTFAAAVHLVLSQPNGLIQETVRAFLRTWYAELTEGIPTVSDGLVYAGATPGHGVRLRPETYQRRDISVTTSRT